MKFYWLALGVLAVWRVTHLFAHEDGPANLVLRLRRAAGTGFWASLMDCFLCLSLWVAIPFALWLGEAWDERLLLWLGLSGGAILAERLTERSPAPFIEENAETDNGMLRVGQRPAAHDGSLGHES
jgi:hypothetical protein